jgi:hypothetical protein
MSVLVIVLALCADLCLGLVSSAFQLMASSNRTTTTQTTISTKTTNELKSSIKRRSFFVLPDVLIRHILSYLSRVDNHTSVIRICRDSHTNVMRYITSSLRIGIVLSSRVRLLYRADLYLINGSSITTPSLQWLTGHTVSHHRSLLPSDNTTDIGIKGLPLNIALPNGSQAKVDLRPGRAYFDSESHDERNGKGVYIGWNRGSCKGDNRGGASSTRFARINMERQLVAIRSFTEILTVWCQHENIDAIIICSCSDASSFTDRLWSYMENDNSSRTRNKYLPGTNERTLLYPGPQLFQRGGHSAFRELFTRCNYDFWNNRCRTSNSPLQCLPLSYEMRALHSFFRLVAASAAVVADDDAVPSSSQQRSSSSYECSWSWSVIKPMLLKWSSFHRHIQYILCCECLLLKSSHIIGGDHIDGSNSLAPTTTKVITPTTAVVNSSNSSGAVGIDAIEPGNIYDWCRWYCITHSIMFYPIGFPCSSLADRAMFCTAFHGVAMVYSSNNGVPSLPSFSPILGLPLSSISLNGSRPFPM